MRINFRPVHSALVRVPVIVYLRSDFLIDYPDLEGIMRIRLTALTLGLCLSFALLGCNKPAAPADSSSSSSTSSPPSSDNSNNSSSPSGNSANSPSGAPSSAMSNSAMSSMKPEPPKALVVPAGTVLTVRLGEAVGSKISSPGQTFSATLASAVTVDGRTAIPAGASANGTVVDAKPLGRFKGGASLEVQLTSVTVNGAEHAIQTAAVTQTEKGKGKRTAVLAGGGAGLGAVVGALAGGGKGAAIGALAGGGAGTAGAAFTGNKDIVLPAESALTFTLSQPLDVKEKE